MTPFEQELKQALARQEPPADFTARVLARCQVQEAKARGAWWRIFRAMPAWRFAMVAAALLMVGGGTVYQQHERATRGIAAKRKLLLAVRIAATKLQEVQERVAESAETEQ